MPKSKKLSKTGEELQLSLFQNFISNSPEDVSNTIEMWESIPKYFFTPAQIKKLRTDKGLAESFKWTFKYQNTSCTVKIQPALIENKDGTSSAYFPGVTEELVEEALKKIFTQQNYGFHNPSDLESWVKFSLRMVQRELKSRGRDRNLKQIKHAIEVMSSCIITLYQEDKEVYKGAILSDLITVNRDQYLADRDSQHVARLPVFISKGINALNYRQFNYSRLMECDEQLSRWLYKRFINKFRQASITNNYHFMYSLIAEESGLLQGTIDQAKRRKVHSALEELKGLGVIRDYTIDIRKENRRITDVKYNITASHEFIKEQKAAKSLSEKVRFSK